MELNRFRCFPLNGTSREELLACTCQTELLSIPWRKPLLQQAELEGFELTKQKV
jgi:hypothetical protein